MRGMENIKFLAIFLKILIKKVEKLTLLARIADLKKGGKYK